MSYLYVSKRKQPKSSKPAWLIASAVVVVLLIIIALRFSLLSLFTSWWRGEVYIFESTANASGWLSGKAELIARIDRLERDKEELRAALAMEQAKARAYDNLVGEFAATSGTSTAADAHISGIEGTLARIIRRPPFTVFDTYVVDRGTADGIIVGALAYAQGIPVGTVQSVTESNAVISMFSSPGVRTLVTFGTTSLQYEAYGIGNSALRSDVPRDAAIEEGMEVTAGDRAVSLYGVVSAIDRNVQGTSKSVFISLPFDFSKTDWLVIKDK